MTDFNHSRQLIRLATIAALAMSMCGCGGDVNSKSDQDKTLIASCDQTQKMGMLTLGATEQVEICTIMVGQLQRNPPIYLLRDILRLAYLMRATGTNEPLDALTLQAMQIVRLRQQQTNDVAIQNTLDVIWKIYQSTQAQVSFGDLQQALTRVSNKASILSDEDLEKIGIVLYQQKTAG